MYSTKEQQYGDVMNICKKIIKSSQPDIVKCIEQVCDNIDDKTIVIADLCTADGINSIDLFSKVKDVIDKRCRDVMLLMEDQTSNDFNALLKNVHCQLQGGNMFLAVSGTDMFKQCYPTKFVHFVFCAFGSHWLSNNSVDCSVENGLFHIDGSESEKRRIADHAAKDWETFLHNRGKELKPGGMMYIISLVRREDGSYGSQEFHRQLTKVQKEMLDLELITKEEYAEMFINSYIRTEEETKRPFNEINELSPYGLKIESYKVDEWTDERHPGSCSQQQLKEDWASRLLNIAKTWSYKPLASALHKRTDADKDSVMGMFYEKLRENLLLCEFDLNYTVADIILSKH